jgi:Xaa-Pro aminopeptidase
MPVEFKQTWDSKRLKRDRQALLQAEMQRQGIGGLYLSEIRNVRYVVTTRIPGGRVFVPAQGEPIAFVRPRDVGYVSTVHSNIRPPFTGYKWDPEHGERLGAFGQGMLDLLTEHGAAGLPLAVDELDASSVLSLVQAGIKVVDAEDTVERGRSTKTQDEIEIYRCLGQQYAYTLGAFREAIRPGVSENELAGLVVNKWYECGGEDMFQLNVCAGENMNPWRRWPTQRVLQEGEFVGIDLHGHTFEGLQGDASRTFLVGDNPTLDQQALYQDAYDYLQATTELFRAGRSIPELLAALPAVPDKFHTKLYNYNVGHCIGMVPSGYPTVAKWKRPLNDTLKANQVLAIETYFAAEDASPAVKLEQMVLVREGPPEVLDASAPFDARLLR